VLAAFGLALAAPARAAMTAEELAKAVQNPVANLISVPFQNDTNANLARTFCPGGVADCARGYTMPVRAQQAFDRWVAQSRACGDQRHRR
jgi:hypothetical protein